ncbi:glycosyl transferase family 2 [Mangrovimonas yunxiaonensis]|uniref:Glycosyl transferase family 2 n=1 Tax=Mangrovimonas yunxiaonensis TaxID=1197477 RepID=A0A084THX4_9FLAO|nr:glycosyltransferase family 2 protein [Mangrovimonas yunxiaonensis]KFB00310.1 glycosyl transferase family 2 [Mangrovimonas yunxiaonensis]GGH41632.1 glycosyl transferase [Mangrovimonas yunxiaonensis]
MQNDLISILTPFKNTALFLPECIDSILTQTYKNWELIIVDDGSTDESPEIVAQYAKLDARIKHFKAPEKGIIKALRFALKQASGKYITRMDSDDVMPNYKLEMLHNNLKKHGEKHVATGLVRYFNPTHGVSNGYIKYEKWLNRLTMKGANFSEIYKECVIASPCWMVHKNDLMACGAFNLDRYPEDYDLTFRFYKHGFTCIPCDTVLHHWRDYSTRTSRTHEHYAHNYFLELKLHYFLELDYDSNRPLALWGAGFKGKHIAKALIERHIPFYWICNNPNKINKKIYQAPLLSFEHLKQLEHPQSIITVANGKQQKMIKQYFNDLNMTAMTDYFFFC